MSFFLVASCFLRELLLKKNAGWSLSEQEGLIWSQIFRVCRVEKSTRLIWSMAVPDRLKKFIHVLQFTPYISSLTIQSCNVHSELLNTSTTMNTFIGNILVGNNGDVLAFWLVTFYMVNWYWYTNFSHRRHLTSCLNIAEAKIHHRIGRSLVLAACISWVNHLWNILSHTCGL